jgi:hypothetical protein
MDLVRRGRDDRTVRRRTVGIAVGAAVAAAGLTVGALTWTHDGTAPVPPTAHFVTTLPLAAW